MSQRAAGCFIAIKVSTVLISIGTRVITGYCRIMGVGKFSYGHSVFLTKASAKILSIKLTIKFLGPINLAIIPVT